MRKGYYLLLGSLLILAALGTVPVQAYYLQNVGGNAAKVGDTSPVRMVNPTLYHYSDGLRVIAKASTTNTIICPVQLRSTNPVQYIYLRFQTSRTDARITKITIRDGTTRVRAFTPTNATSWSGPGAKTVTLALGTTRSYANGMTMVLNIQNVNTTSSGTFNIYGYGAGTTYSG